MTVNGDLRTEQQRRLRKGDRLYRRYGQPLDREFRGKYLIITPDGKTVVGETPLEAMQRAKEAFGPGGHLFKVGEDAAWMIR